MRSSKVSLMAASALAALCCAGVVAAQSKPPEKNPSSTTASAKDIVVLDASSQLSQLKDQKVGAGKKVTAVPINVSQASGYRQGLDLVAFRLAGTIDKADGKSTPAAEQPTAGGGSDKGTGTVMLQAIVSTRPDLTYEEVMRIANRGGGKPPSDLRDTAQKEGNPPKEGTPPKDVASGIADASGSVVLCECRTSALPAGGKGRTFEVVGFAPPEAGHVTPDLMADIRRRLTETTAAAAKNDPASPGAAVGAMAAEPRPPDVKQALDSIEKGKAFLYINLVPEMPIAGKPESDPSGAGDAGACTLKDISLVFAAVPKSAP